MSRAAEIRGTTQKTVRRIIETYEVAGILHHCHTVVTDADSYRMRQARANGGTPHKTN